MSEYQHQIHDVELYDVDDSLFDISYEDSTDNPSDPEDTHVEGVDIK